MIEVLLDFLIEGSTIVIIAITIDCLLMEMNISALLYRKTRLYIVKPINTLIYNHKSIKEIFF